MGGRLLVCPSICGSGYSKVYSVGCCIAAVEILSNFSDPMCLFHCGIMHPFLSPVIPLSLPLSLSPPPGAESPHLQRESLRPLLSSEDEERVQLAARSVGPTPPGSCGPQRATPSLYQPLPPIPISLSSLLSLPSLSPLSPLSPSCGKT